MNNLYIIGCGGHGRNVADVALSLYPKDNIFFVDEKAKKNEKILGISVLKKLPDNAEKSHVASGKNLNRKKKKPQPIYKTSQGFIYDIN